MKDKFFKEQVQFFKVDQEYHEQRLDNFLLRVIKGVPRALVYRLIRTDEIRVNKKRVKPSTRLSEGDEIRVAPISMARSIAMPISKSKAFTENLILFEDDNLLIVNKPSGVAVHGGSGISLGLIEQLRYERSDARFLELVHRLDRETSGCLMVAKKRSMLTAIQQLMRLGKVHKKYIGVVAGQWPETLTKIDLPLQKNQLQSGERLVKVHQDGKPSITKFKVQQRFQYGTLLNISLITGRTHQIRAHCAHNGFPLLGDEKYGDKETNKRMNSAGVKRLLLHANSIQFVTEAGYEIKMTAPLHNNFPLEKLNALHF